ncbi:hypothetical protein JTL55_36080, partial [Pseudomonas aeruginosa]|nr:hypothetical protein [Pseudomonas aeruginosa]
IGQKLQWACCISKYRHNFLSSSTKPDASGEVLPTRTHPTISRSGSNRWLHAMNYSLNQSGIAFGTHSAN